MPDAATISAIAMVFSIIGLGVLARRLDWLTAEADASLVRLTVRMLLPCFVLGGMGHGQWDAGDLLLPPLTGFFLASVGIVLCGGVAYALGPRLGLHTPGERRAFALTAGLYNYGYVPIPLVSQLFPDDAGTLSTLLLHNVGVEVAMWTVGVAALMGRLGRRAWLGVFNPVVLAIAVALLLRGTGVWPLLPAWVVRLVDLVGGATVPLALILTGAMISDVWAAADLRRGWRTVAGACVMRLAVLPMIFLLTAWLLRGGPQLDRVLAIQAAMPAAVFPIVLTRHYGGDTATAVRVVVGTSVVGLLTMPLWLAIGLGR